MMALVSLEEEEERPDLSISPPCEDTQKAAVCKPGREPSPGPSHAGTLTLDFQAPEL